MGRGRRGPPHPVRTAREPALSRFSPNGVALSLFAVDDRSAQVVWRNGPPGGPELSIVDERGRTITRIGSDPNRSGSVGAAVADGLPADTPLELRAHSSGHLQDVGSHGIRIPFRTLRRPPGEELCRVATVSDLHLGTRVFGHRGTITEPPHPDGPHPLRCTRAAISDLTAWGARHLIAKGDITNSASLAQWRTWAEIVESTSIPVDSLPGNHDRDHPLSTRPIDAADARRLFGFSIAAPLLVRDLPGLRLVLVDTCIPGSNRGTLAGVRAETLDAAADAPADATVLVFLHHQLEPRTGPEGWPIGIRHREARAFLRDLAAAHPRSFVSSGHTHRHRRWSHAGITTTQVGSVKDYPGVWAGYRILEGGLVQTVRRVGEPSCLAWTDRTRRAVAGAWRFISPGPARSRTFALDWSR